MYKRINLLKQRHGRQASAVKLKFTDFDFVVTGVYRKIIFRSLLLLTIFVTQTPFLYSAYGLQNDALVSGKNGFDVKIAVVDVESIFEHSIAIKDIKVKINKLSEEIQAEMSDREIELKKMEASLIRQRKDFSEVEFEAKVAEFNLNVSKIQKLLQSRKAALEQAHTNAISSVHQTTIGIIDELSKKYGFNLVLPSTQVLYAGNDLDITLEVITHLNRRLTSIEINLSQKVIP